MSELIHWLSEDTNPAVKYRTQTELLGETANKDVVIRWLTNKLPEHWTDEKGLRFTYYITAFAECGLSREDLPKEAEERLLRECEKELDCGCETFLLFTSMLKLGYGKHPVMTKILSAVKQQMLPDGGYVCERIRKKAKHTPKSCYKADLHALCFLGECKKSGLNITELQPLIDYFLKRNLFYKGTDKASLVLNDREGWRTIDTFYPFEPMRVGIQNVVEAFCALGYGNSEYLTEAWELLNNHKDETGKFILKGTMTKSYLPKTKEKEGQPSKWVTFYALLAEKEAQK